MWTLNVWLFLCFLFAPAQYQAKVAAGEPCYGYATPTWLTEYDTSPQPVCFYDPTNVNPGK